MLSTLVLLVELVDKTHMNMDLLVDTPLETGRNTVFQLLEDAYKADPFSAMILKILKKGTSYFFKTVLTGCS